MGVLAFFISYKNVNGFQPWTRSEQLLDEDFTHKSSNTGHENASVPIKILHGRILSATYCTHFDTFFYFLLLSFEKIKKLIKSPFELIKFRTFYIIRYGLLCLFNVPFSFLSGSFLQMTKSTTSLIIIFFLSFSFLSSVFIFGLDTILAIFFSFSFFFPFF